MLFCVLFLVSSSRFCLSFLIPLSPAASRVGSLRAARSEQAHRLESARSTLAHHVSDFNVGPDELRQLQQQMSSSQILHGSGADATTGHPSEGGTDATGHSTAAIKRRLQMNPLFTHNLSKFHTQLALKLSKYRLRLVDQLLQLYVIRRKSPHSCSIAGLELMDEPDVMLSSIRSPRPIVLTTEGAPLAYTGLPGTDPEVVAAALGYIVLVLHMLSCYLAVRLPYTVKFHASNSFVTFNDAEETRYYLTLIDHPDATHFRRAITLVDHNIQYFCEQMGAGRVTHAGVGRTGAGDARHVDSSSAPLNLTPLHLLPNMLTLIETIFLHLRQQRPDPYAEREQRMQQARAMHRANQMMQTQTTQPLQAPSHAPPPATHTTHIRSPSTIPTRTLSPPHAMDHSISQSMVTVRHPSVSPAPRISSARSPAGSSDPSSLLQESPPFFADQAHRAATIAAIASADVGGGGALGESTIGLASPVRSHRMRDEFARALDSEFAQSPSADLLRSDLITPSQLFGLAPNGYLAMEEPRESVLLLQAPHSAHRSPHSQPAQSPPRTATDHAHTRAHAAAHSMRSSPHCTYSSSPTAASMTPPHLQQVRPVATSVPPFRTHVVRGPRSPARAGLATPTSAAPNATFATASYATDAEVEWDMVEVSDDARAVAAARTDHATATRR